MDGAYGRSAAPRADDAQRHAQSGAGRSAHGRMSSLDEEDMPPLKQAEAARPRAGRRAAGSDAPASSGWGSAASPAAAPAQHLQQHADADAGDDGRPQYGRRRDGAPEEKRRDGWNESDVVQDLAEIPTLDAVAEEDITRQVADAPQVKDTRVQSLRELDRAIASKIPAGNGDGVDLSLLASALLPRELVDDPDVAWDHDALFARISAEFQTEKERLGAEGSEPDTRSEGVVNVK